MINYNEMSDLEINNRVAKALLFEPTANITFDPCNNWTLSGFILETSGICVSRVNDGVWNAFTGNYGWIANNPRRAICIVFLMMNEGKDANKTNDAS